MNKITFIGDAMCEPMLLKASEKPDGSYDFNGVFRNLKDMFSEADYVIANLETPLAGKEAGFTDDLFSFNTPDEFAAAMKKAGVSFVSTANNHCIDRGFDGLLRTIKALDRIGLPHSGTFSSGDARTEAHYAEINGTKIAVIPYTYGVNYFMHKTDLSKEQEECVNLLHSYDMPVYGGVPSVSKNPAEKLLRGIINFLFRDEIKRITVKKKLGLVYNVATADNYIDEKAVNSYVDRLLRDIDEARSKADCVIFYPHIGGQFNIEPGKFTDHVFEKVLSQGKVDAVIGSHPHIVQKAEIRNNVPVFYSIGNFSMSPNSVYLLHEHLPQYGLAVHMYLENGRIVRTAFSVLVIVESKEKPLTVYNAADLYNKGISDAAKEKLRNEVKQIWSTVTGNTTDDPGLKKEYILEK